MKRFLNPLILSFLVKATLFSQTPVDSEITEVYVYQGSARVTREAQLDLVAGENELLFRGLPIQLNADQIQVGLKDGVPIRLDNLKFKQNQDREDTEEEADLKEKIEQLRDRIQILNADKTNEQGKVNFANSLSASFTGGFGEAEHDLSSMDRVSEILAFQQKVSAETQAAIRSIDKQLKELEKEAKELLEELAKLTNKNNQLQGEVTVRLFAQQAGSAQLVFNYLVPNANWFPSYAVRVNSTNNTMEMVYQANLWQNSGESWEDVAVTVSTSQPNRSGNVPELFGVFLQPNQYKRGREEVYELAPFSADQNADAGYAAKASMAGTRLQTTVQAGMSSFSATLPTRVTLESENEPSRFPMLTSNFKSEFWSEVVPLLQERGFLKAKTKNAFDLPLISGQAQVFIDGTLTSTVSMPYALPGDELELSLGVDDFIIVKRKETLRATEYAGLIDKTTVLKRAYTVEVTNFHPLGHKVKVFERFPISQNEKIVVKRKAPTNLGDRIKEDTGVFYWEETLASKQLKEYNVEFEVVHPREWNLDNQI
jgi:uncharacterized protein (TIGR02231 family)